MSYDLIVIGGGPAGYVGAIRAAQLGKSAACVEMDRAGGTCLNWGCIPTKSLLHTAELYHLLKHGAGDFGLKIDGLAYDWGSVIGRSRKVSDRLAGGIEFLFKKNGVDYFPGQASLDAPGKVTVTDAGGNRSVYDTQHILIATGCFSRPFPGFPFNGKSVIGSKEAMVLAGQPKEMVIIGAGAIGVEFAYFFNAFGTKVILVEMMPHILPQEDEEVSLALEKSLTRQGIEILTNTEVTGTNESDGGVEITVEGSDTRVLKGDTALIAIGVQPSLPTGVDLKTDGGYIVTDHRYQTSSPGIYAAGDVIGPPWLAHVASWEAIQCVDGLFTDHAPRKVEVFPGCTYCHPQVASVGLTERAAKESGVAYRVGKFPFQASGKAQAIGQSEGFVKLLFGEKYGQVIGAHIIGPGATEMIAELGLAMTLEATKDDLAATIHAHPTLAEAVHEAVGQAYGHAVHIPN